MKKILKYFTIAFFIITIVLTISLNWIDPPVSSLMIIRKIENKLDHKKYKVKMKWINLDKIQHWTIASIIFAEDPNFPDHNGFDFEAIKNAYKINKKSKIKIGASTITQQCAKNLFLWSGKSWLRKGLEAYFTLLMETFLSKNRILEIYLNIIETGNGIFGIEAASNFYFNKNTSKLTLFESSLVATILPNPRKRDIFNLSKNLYIKQNKIINRMYKIGNVKFKKIKNKWDFYDKNNKKVFLQIQIKK